VIADGNFELGNYDVAARQLEELAARAGVNEAILSRRAKLAAIRGQNARAVRLAAHALLRAARLDLRPSEAAFYRFQLATFLSQAGNQAGALRAVRAGLGIDPDHVPSQELEARLLVSLGRLRPAARRYESLVARTPAADLHGLLARVYEALGKDGAARREIARGLELGYDALGRYPAERRHLASFFAEFDPPIAVEAALADFATRQDVGAYDALAWAYHRSGDVDNAARYVDGALAQGTRSAPLLAHAGLIEHAVGHERRARALLTEALALDPNFDLVHAPIARRTLESLRGAGS
jgi:tetratricopeptide (TPR) repeat protein